MNKDTLIKKLCASDAYEVTDFRVDKGMKRLEVRVKFNEYNLGTYEHHVIDKIRDIIEPYGYVFYDMSNHFHKVKELDKYDTYYYDDIYDYTRIVFEEDKSMSGNPNLISRYFDTIIELADEYINNDYDKVHGLLKIRAKAKEAKEYIDAFGLK